MTGGERRTVRSVEHACRLIEALRETGPTTITSLAERLDLSPGSVHTHLATLKQFGMVHQNGTAYQLGPRFITLGEYVRMQTAMYDAARDEVEKLAHRCGAAAHLICAYEGQLLVVDEAFGEEAIGKAYYTRQRDSPVNYFHCSSAGKAILAHLPEPEVDRILEAQGLPKLTSNTITERDELKAELASIRETGVAFNDEERLKGVRTIGAPILQDFDRVLGAISISGPSTEWKGERYRTELPQLLTRTVNEVEINLHADDEMETKLVL